MTEIDPETDFVLTMSCADRRGIVHALASFLLDQGATIVESRQFSDDATQQFFLRIHFRSEVGAVDLECLRKELAPVAATFAMTWALHDLSSRARALVLVSRQGHCLNDLLYRARTNAIPVEIVAVVSNHSDFEELTAWHGIAFHHLPVTTTTRLEAEASLRELIAHHAADTVILARYMQILSPQLCADLAGRVINIHHSLLPSFTGARPYHQAHARGVKVIGATAHYVTAELDEGPIIEQDFIRVDHALGAGALAARGRDLEAMALARAVKWHAEHRVLLDGARTVVFA